MTDVLVVSRGARPRSERRRARYWLDVSVDYASVGARWQAMAQAGSALAFQRDHWLSSWYATLGRKAGVLPLAVTVVDAHSGRDMMALPLVRREVDGLSTIEFADCGLTDYNAPILAAEAPRDAAGAQNIWNLLRARLPAADVVSLVKMPREIAGAPNPLALVPTARPSRLNGNILHVEGEWSDWHQGLERTFRKELERSWRVFEKNPGAQFVRLTDAREAAGVFAQLKRLQSARIREQGLPYVLDEPENEAFYDRLLAVGAPKGGAILTALKVGETVVAALLGIATGRHYSMVRLATAGAEWKNCSPGRLVIERTMKALHEKGFRIFDFTIGDYAYKRRLGVASVPLCEVDTALSWRGLPRVGVARAKAMARGAPALAGAIARLKR